MQDTLIILSELVIRGEFIVFS